MTEAAIERREIITDKAKELLTGRTVGSGNHRLLMSAHEAHIAGDAVSSRNYETLHMVLGGAINTMVDTYNQTSIDTVQSTWEAPLQQVTGVKGDTLELLANAECRERLIERLKQDSYGDTLDIDPIAYVKMLETFAFATTPDVDDFKERYFTAKSHRKCNSERALFSRAMLTLRTLADQEPGIRNVREKLLDDDTSGFDEYLRRYSSMMLAREAYSTIAETLNERGALDTRDQVRHELGALQSEEELQLTHLLSWTILPPSIMENRDKRALKKFALDRAVSEHQRRKLTEDWSDERIELIFDIARLGHDAKRHPQIYLSDTFDNGAGIYLAVGLTHPRDATKQIVVADNPVNGNALYFVDELHTLKEDDSGYAWNEVLGVSKRIARERGATRKYHTGNWIEVAHAVCEYQGEARPIVPAQSVTPAFKEANDVPQEYENDVELSPMMQLEQQIKMAKTVLAQYHTY